MAFSSVLKASGYPLWVLSLAQPLGEPGPPGTVPARVTGVSLSLLSPDQYSHASSHPPPASLAPKAPFSCTSGWKQTSSLAMSGLSLMAVLYLHGTPLNKKERVGSPLEFPVHGVIFPVPLGEEVSLGSFRSAHAWAVQESHLREQVLEEGGKNEGRGRTGFPHRLYPTEGGASFSIFAAIPSLQFSGELIPRAELEH